MIYRAIRKLFWFLISEERELRSIIAQLDEFAYVCNMIIHRRALENSGDCILILFIFPGCDQAAQVGGRSGQARGHAVAVHDPH